MNKQFEGFQESDANFTGIPDAFFRDILPFIKDINELKICLYVLWKANTVGNYGLPITTRNILLDKVFIEGLETNSNKIEKTISSSLEKAVSDNILLKSENKDQKEGVYFINSPRGRKAAKANTDKLQPSHLTLDHIQPNIFRLYQENIGPLTPIIADALRDAEKNFPFDWIKEAVQIAIKNNVRRWRYVETILDRWQKEGRNGTDRKNNKEDYRRYIKGEYGEIGHH